MTDDAKQRVYWEDEHGFRPYNHRVVQVFAQQRLDYLQRWLNLSNIKRVLDVGCGNGFSTFYMRRYVTEIWGMDRSRRMLADHPLRAEGRLNLADAFQLPFASNSFDLVYGWEVLHHMSNPTLAIAEMARVSRRYVLIAEPNRNNPAQFAFAILDPEHRWVLRYTLSYMRRLFVSAGLQVEYGGSGGWLFPNVTPLGLLPVIKWLPYSFPLGISNWVLGVK